MHTDGEEQGRGLGRDVQNVPDDGILFNFYSHESDLLVFIFDYYNRTCGKKQEESRKRYAAAPQIFCGGVVDDQSISRSSVQTTP